MDLEYIRSHGLILLECISGSKVYNLDLKDSDTDIRGVFYLPKNQFYADNYIPQISDSNNDIVFYEIGRFIELLSKNNPSMLELMATPESHVIYKHPLLDSLNLSMFLSKKCKDTFGGFALTQIRKAGGLHKKIFNPVSKERKSILDFCYVLKDQGSMPLKTWLALESKMQERIGLVKIPHFKNVFGLYYSESDSITYKGVLSNENANAVSLSPVEKGAKAITQMFFNQDGYTKHCKDHQDYWAWVENRNQSRFEVNIKHNRNYDSKNMMHTIRLLDMAYEILSEGRIEVVRPNREELLDIRFGKWTYDELMEQAQEKMLKIESAYSNSALPELPDYELIETSLINIRKALYKE